MPVSVDLVALTLLPVWRWRLIVHGLREGSSPDALLEQHCADLTAHRSSKPSRSHSAASMRTRARTAIERAHRLSLNLIAWNDPAFPALLAAIVDPPPVLWLRGQRQVFDLPAVAIVGSRRASDYALAVADHLAADLVEAGVVVVSGLARGVDSAAHRGALSARGRTIAVFGSGVDIVYPPEHDTLATDIEATGALVSEFVPGTPPNPQFFPQRNRIISGLSHAVVVVEADEKSGSLITARFALEQGREVFAVPGNVLSGANRGGHALLRDGAALVESADDVLRELNAARARVLAYDARLSAGPGGAGDFGAAEPSGPPAASKRAELDLSRHAADPVLACLVPGESCDLDVIAARSSLPPSYLLRRLLELEVDGVVRRTDEGRFVRFDRSC